jgi:hypothetical protein
MVIALCWENARAFDRWVDSIRILRHSDDDDPEVLYALIENMPTPWRYGSLSENGRGESLSISDTRACIQDGDSCNSIADKQLALKILERNLELVGNR